MPAPKWTKLTPDMRHNIVIEYVKKNGGAFSTFEKIATEAQLRTGNSICSEAICVYIAITLSSFIRMGWNLVFPCRPYALAKTVWCEKGLYFPSNRLSTIHNSPKQQCITHKTMEEVVWRTVRFLAAPQLVAEWPGDGRSQPVATWCPPRSLRYVASAYWPHGKDVWAALKRCI